MSSLPYQTVKASPSTPSFSTNLASSQPPLQAQYLRVFSPMVDQNPGAMSQLASPPASTVPATEPWLRASPQCSTFWRLPADSFIAKATSPTAKMPGALVRIEESVTTPPFSVSRPPSSASRVRALTPAASRTVSVKSLSPLTATSYPSSVLSIP